VFITGASSGIGEQLAKRMTQLGAAVVVLSARRVNELERVKKECESLRVSKDQKIEIFQLDLSDPDTCLKKAQEYDGRVDILINNGGVYQSDLFLNTDLSVCTRIMNVNCLSPIALIKGFLPRMIKQEGGAQIVNILSVAGLLGVPFGCYYSASKFGLDGFGKALQAETAQHNISVTQCYPAYIQTALAKNALQADGSKFGKTDQNIAEGIPVEEACEDMIRAIHLKRFWIIIGSLFYQVGPRLLQMSETLTYRVGFG